MVRSIGRDSSGATRGPREARVVLLIPTRVLPPLSYRVPESLADHIQLGTAVVAPLSGYSRLGIVVETADGGEGERHLEDLRSVIDRLSLPANIVKLCRWVSEAAAMPLPNALRSALPPGLDTGNYRLLDPASGWPWSKGSFVSRTTLRRALGGEVLKRAEAEGRLELAPGPPARKTVEWAVTWPGASPDLGRAPRQRVLFEFLQKRGGECSAPELLAGTGASRRALRELVRRGAVGLEHRPEPAPIFFSRGEGTTGKDISSFLRETGRVVDRGGAWLWRTPTQEHADIVATVAQAAVEGDEQALVLAPEIRQTERLVRHLRDRLPAGHSVAVYHSALGRGRGAVYEAARDGEVSVLVGTRTAAMLPMPRLGVVCVVDEPNEAHRAEPGYEGLPIHVRDIAMERSRIEGAGILFLSPFPSPSTYARDSGVREIPARTQPRWPEVRIVDMRGSGASLSRTLLDVCRESVKKGERVGVIANRLGYATTVSCSRCGAIQVCPGCDIPLALHEYTRLLVCGRCGFQKRYAGGCEECGSDRMSPTGLAVERVREEISREMGVPAGLLTAGDHDLKDAPVVVGTPHSILDTEWDTVLIPDTDASLMGSGMSAVSRAFRLLYRAAEVARERLVIQTRSPEHYALQAAVRGDYPAFAAAEFPRLRAMGYPPYAHLAALTFEGPEDAVRRAVESKLRPVLEGGVEMSSLVPLSRPGGRTWRVLLRSRERPAVARFGDLAARLATEHRGPDGFKVLVEVDPEEV